MDEIVSIVNTIYYYSSTGPELRPNSSLFYIRDFNDTDYWYIDFHHGEYLNQSIARMDKTAIEDMRNGRITLCLNNSHEAFHDVVDSIYQHYVIGLGIPPKHIVLLSESAIIDQEVKRVASLYNQDTINVEWLRMFEYNLKQTQHQQLATLEDKHYEKKFLNLNRRWREHRIMFVALLQLHGLLNQGFVSLAAGVDGASWERAADSFLWCINDEELLNTLYTRREEYESLPPMYLDTKDLHINQATMTDSTDYYYANSYFSIVSETNFFKHRGEGVFVSEKIFKPILKKHPFIVITRPHTLRALRSIGYKTFDDIIDESYDTEENDDKRLMMILNETKRLCELNQDQLSDFLSKAREICEFNYNALMNQTNFITKLI